MNLADMLSYADIRELSKIANTYSCECSTNSKNELIQSILSSVGRKDVFERQVVELSLEDIRFINSLLFERRDLFSLEELLARVNQTRFMKEEDSEWNPREMIAKFKQRGWLFNGHSQQTKYLFQVPQDLKRRIGDALAKQFAARLHYTQADPSVYRDEQSLFSADVSSFLRYLFQQDVQLSADGYIYKRNLQQMLDSLAVQEEPIGRTAWRFGYGRRFKEYPDRFSLLYDYCYFHHLISEEGQQLELTPEGRKRLEQGGTEDVRSIYQFWLKLYKSAVPNLQAIVQWIDKLAASWVTVDSLQEVLVPLIKPFYYDSAESILNNRIIRMMMHIGLLKIGEEDGCGQVIMLTKLGSGVIKGTYVREEEKIDLPIDKP
ncbi:hypothetical protein [Paenibacillus sp. J2TS4]|uniref:hypothetical protein n=1 Tax=Paenibacillus sp. J2TS4 TaxID=2807194 RepID=UPI001B003F1A|nr:hypothetical protein [Paenibacillus sp. J2TS4]GIP32408.1 hypothetical protein J2TS4_16180 [Paenibacillus sp. J2TS4]